MIKKLKIIQYRKLKDLEFLFSENINVISGTNGTCKTSLLHLISNSFQTFSKKEKLINGNSTQVIRWLNKECNPKIESLTRGDREYSDPANGIKGTLFSVEYFDGKKLDFRRHNSNKESLNGRFSIKPKYKKGKNESLPHLLLIYLGLSRLYSFGEFNNDGGIEKIKKKLPLKYIQEIEDIYKDFTGIEIKYENSCLMSGIKRRSEFKTNYQGIDSNTISAGEDNLLIIITALVSLKYHHENAIEGIELTSILLVDEIDATLHPEYQIKLLELFLEYSRKYKIQIFLTTHSMSLLEYCLEEKFNVIYLLDDINKISIMKDINKYKIERILKNKTRQEINSKKIIPIFTEDEEARLFLSRIFNQLENIDSDFKKIKKFFYLVNINMSCHDLKKLFSDDNMLRNMTGSICILDGDCKEYSNDKNRILILPGEKSPEEFIFNYSQKLYDVDDKIWGNEYLIDEGYTKRKYQTSILPEILQNEKKDKNKRSGRKEIFKKYNTFFCFLFENWLKQEKNQDEIQKFSVGLKNSFKKVANFNNIDPNIWK